MCTHVKHNANITRGLLAYIAPLNFMQGRQLRPSSLREFQRNPLNIVGAVAI